MKNGGQRPPFAFKLCVMALYYDLPVFKDVYKLTLLIYSLTKDFSKEYKYTLGQDLKKDVMVLMRSIYRANKAQNKQKGYWISSVEFNPLYNTETPLSFGSTAILNFGYRWNLMQNKNSSNIWNRWSKAPN